MAVPENSCYPFNLIALMERLGIDPAEGVIPRGSLHFAAAFRRCEACQIKLECRAWLDSAPISVPFSPPFCPNRDILFELQVGRLPLNAAPSPEVLTKSPEPHAHIADLERLEQEIEEALLCEPHNEALSSSLKRRRSYLREEIAGLRQQAAPDKRST